MNVNHDDMKNILFVQDPGEYRLLDFNIQDISLYVARFNAKNERGEMVSPGICLNEKRLSMILEKGKYGYGE